MDEKVRELEDAVREAEYTKQKSIEREQSREKLLEVLEDKSRKLERELDLNEQLATTAKKEADQLKHDN